MSKRTIVKDASYTAHAIDMISIIIFNSATDCALTLPSPIGLIYADCDVHNKGAGAVTIGAQTVATGSHAHISSDGAAWVVVVGGGAETDPVFTASTAAGITTADITQWNNAQKNSDILKSEIEEKLTGEIDSHFHRTKPQQWKGYPDSPEEAKAFPYQIIDGEGDSVYLDCYSKEVFSSEDVVYNHAYWSLQDNVWTFGHASQNDEGNLSWVIPDIVACNWNIYSNSSKETLVYARQNDERAIPTGVATYYEPLVNGDPTAPEVMFDDSGDIIMVEV